MKTNYREVANFPGGATTEKRRSNETSVIAVHEKSDKGEKLITCLAAMKTSLPENEKLKEGIFERSNVTDKTKNEVEYNLRKEPAEANLDEGDLKNKKFKSKNVKMLAITEIIEGKRHMSFNDSLLNEENFLSVGRLTTHYCKLL